jgi:hypothetical protein
MIVPRQSQLPGDRTASRHRRLTPGTATAVITIGKMGSCVPDVPSVSAPWPGHRASAAAVMVLCYPEKPSSGDGCHAGRRPQPSRHMTMLRTGEYCKCRRPAQAHVFRAPRVSLGTQTLGGFAAPCWRVPAPPGCLFLLLLCSAIGLLRRACRCLPLPGLVPSQVGELPSSVECARSVPIKERTACEAYRTGRGVALGQPASYAVRASVRPGR